MPDSQVYVGNLADMVTQEEIETLFADYGTVTRCSIIGNYGFVHLDSENAGIAAVEALNGHTVQGRHLKVEISRSVEGERDTRSEKGRNIGKSRKVFVGNLPPNWVKQDIENVFAAYGTIVESDMIRNYGFIHYANEDQAALACKADGTEHDGHVLRVSISNSVMRKKPGMGGRNGCFICGASGHWGRDCPSDKKASRRMERVMVDRSRPYSRSAPYERFPGYPPSAPRYDPYERPREPYARPQRPSYADEQHYGGDAYYRDPYARAQPARERYYDDPYARPAPRSKYEAERYRVHEQSYGRQEPDYYERPYH